MEKANSVEAGTVGAGEVREGSWLAGEHARRGTRSAEALGRRRGCEMWLETGRPSSSGSCSCRQGLWTALLELQEAPEWWGSCDQVCVVELTLVLHAQWVGSSESYERWWRWWFGRGLLASETLEK